MKNNIFLKRYMQEFDAICGWIDPIFIKEFFILNDIHKEKNIEGNILEIGSYQNKTFIPLSFLLKNNEQIIGVDLFSPIQDDKNGIFINSIHRANYNLKKIYRKDIKTLNYKLIKADSKNTKSDNYLNYLDNDLKYRIIHIDACHSYEYEKNDLEQSKSIIIKNGYIILDDYGNPLFPFVELAVNDFLLENKNFIIEKQMYNKIVIKHI